MDELQRKHLIDRLDMVINDVRRELSCELENDEIRDLEAQVRDLTNDLEDMEDKKRDAENESDDLQGIINKLTDILQDIASADSLGYAVSKANEALSLV